MINEDKRLERERRFHNSRYETGDSREKINKLYEKLIEPELRIKELIEADHPKMALEIGCGATVREYLLSIEGLSMHRIDISDAAIKISIEACKKYSNVSHAREDIHTFNAHHKFDAVIGFGVLHHLDLDRALPNISRLLKKSGRAYFVEPQQGSPWLRLFRILTPSIRSPDEKPLDHSSLKLIEKYFDVEVIDRFYYVKPLLIRISLSAKFISAFEKCASLVLPKSWAWQLVLKLKPKV